MKKHGSSLINKQNILKLSPKFNPKLHLVPYVKGFDHLNNIKIRSLSELGYNNIDYSQNNNLIDFGYTEPAWLVMHK